MMNEIVMIPVDRLMHHPDNPRVDLGDLTELADSIKAKGIMQNLTVVPADKVPGKYYVVIGNRRMEAAKQAGLAEVPCVISDMEQKDQIATMLMENMNRQDLTVYEQAQGFQMMMDLGFNEDQISERTGFSKTTVKRRLKMAELDKKQLKKVCEDQQVTLGDFEKLAQIEDVKKRNELLKDMGTGGFDWQLNRALKLQKCAAVIPEVKKRLKEQNIKSIKNGERYGGEYDCHYDWKVELADWNPKKRLIPKVDGETLFYFMDEDTLYFYTKHKRQKADKPKRSEAEIAEEKARAEAWKQIEDDTKTAAELRKAFEADLKMNPKNAPVMLTYFVRAAVLREISYTSPTDEIRRAIGIDSVDWRERTEKAAEVLRDLDIREIPKIIATYFEGEATKPEGYAEGVKSREHPKYKKNHILDACYEWLSAYGYHLSDTEKQLMAGTHPCFEKVKANG